MDLRKFYDEKARGLPKIKPIVNMARGPRDKKVWGIYIYPIVMFVTCNLKDASGQKLDCSVFVISAFLVTLRSGK